MTTTKKTTSKKAKASKARKATEPRKKPTAKRTAAVKPKAAPRAAGGPATGTVLHRKYKDRDLEVRVLPEGYEFDGLTFSSLSALAKHITGYPAISGPVFFKLVEPKRTAKAAK